MTNRVHLLAAAAALLALQPLAFAHLSAADTSTAPSDKKTADAKADKDKAKKICHSETPTGSIRPVRICRTQAEIDADAQQAQDQLDQISRMRRTG